MTPEAVGWCLACVAVGMQLERLLAARTLKHMRRMLDESMRREAETFGQWMALLRRVGDGPVARYTAPGEPTLVPPEPAGAPSAGPERHEPPREGDEGV